MHCLSRGELSQRLLWKKKCYITWDRHVRSVGWKDVRKVGVWCFASIISRVLSLNIRNLETGSVVSHPESLSFRMNSTQVLSILKPGNQDWKLSWKNGTNDCSPHSFSKISSKQEWIYHRLFCHHRWCNMRRWSWHRRRRRHRGISKSRFRRRWWWSRKRCRQDEEKTRRRR